MLKCFVDKIFFLLPIQKFQKDMQPGLVPVNSHLIFNIVFDCMNQYIMFLFMG